MPLDVILSQIFGSIFDFRRNWFLLLVIIIIGFLAYNQYQTLEACKKIDITKSGIANSIHKYNTNVLGYIKYAVMRNLTSLVLGYGKVL